MKYLESIKYVYHATLPEHEQSIRQKILHNPPDSPQFLDFGRGFYVTTNPKQALERAKELATEKALKILHTPDFKRTIASAKGIVLQFELDTKILFSLPEKEYKIFEIKDNLWAEFIAKNRNFNSIYKHPYTWVYGPMADGRYLFQDISDFLNNNIDGNELANKIQPFRPHYDQLSFHDDTFLNSGVLTNCRKVEDVHEIAKK